MWQSPGMCPSPVPPLQTFIVRLDKNTTGTFDCDGVGGNITEIIDSGGEAFAGQGRRRLLV